MYPLADPTGPLEQLLKLIRDGLCDPNLELDENSRLTNLPINIRSRILVQLESIYNTELNINLIEDDISISQLIAISSGGDHKRRARRSQVILFYGNCQMDWWCQHLARASNKRRLEGVEFRWVDANRSGSIDRLNVELPFANKLVYQITQKHHLTPEISNFEIDTFRIPALYFSTLWPFDAGDPRSNRSNGLWSQLFPRGDSLIIKWLASGDTPRDVFSRYMDLDIAKIISLERLYDIELAAARKLDQHADVFISGHISDHFEKEKLFNMVWHPTQFFYRSIAPFLFDFCGFDKHMRDETNKELSGKEMEPFIPPHPSISSYFKLEWCANNSSHRIGNELLTYEDWLWKYISG